MAFNRRDVSKAKADEIVIADEMANRTATLAEDKAFIGRMEHKRFDKMTNDELKRIYNIALRGIYARSRLDKQLANITLRMAEKKATGGLDEAITVEDAYYATRHILELIKGEDKW